MCAFERSKKGMGFFVNYVFVCIGTNQWIEDSFGPRVGDILKKNFDKISNVKVFGTMKSPIHFQNAPVYLDYLKQEQDLIIVIDSALGEKNQIGNTYINLGGIEIGKAFGKSFYFPAHLNIKTIVGLRQKINIKNVNLINTLDKKEQKIRIEQLAQILADKILYSISEMI